jgi:hypothetical protein
MTMATDDVVAAALAAFPQLQRLLTLDGMGWQWMPPPVDDEGRPLEVHGLRFWAGEGQVDGLRVRDLHDAAAVRSDADGGIVWRREGGLVDVVDGLLHLPPPGSPFAPRLVIGSAPKDLWLP